MIPLAVVMVPRWYGIVWVDTYEHKIVNIDEMPYDRVIDYLRTNTIPPHACSKWKEIIAPWHEEFPQVSIEITDIIGKIDDVFLEISGGLKDAAMMQAYDSVKKGFKEDIHVIQGIRAIEDLNEIINILGERLREWYGYYYPEVFDDNTGLDSDLITAIAKNPRRDKIAAILDVPESKLGAEYSAEVLDVIKALARAIIDIKKTRDYIENMVENKVSEIAPTLTASVGPKITALLIASANGLDSLANMASSKIQVLGAEKALFRHMKYGKKPPKHGIIFQHPWIHGAKKSLRGKIARVVASKIAIAARIDAFSTDRSQEEIKKFAFELKRRVDTILSNKETCKTYK